MARLITPHRAIAFKKRGRGRNHERFSVPAKAKYHLMKHDGDPTAAGFEGGFTACNLIVWGDGQWNLPAESMWTFDEISSIPAERLCKKCLGPLHAED